MAGAGVAVEGTAGGALARSMAAIKAVRPASASLLGALATRAMSEAQYFSTGTPPPPLKPPGFLTALSCTPVHYFSQSVLVGSNT